MTRRTRQSPAEWHRNLDLEALESKYGLPIGMMEGLIAKESSGNPNAVSTHNAVGLTQLTPGAVQEMGYGRIDRTNPELSVEIGAKYLAAIKGKREGSIVQALAGYNGGPNRDSLRIKSVREEYIPSIVGYMLARGHSAGAEEIISDFRKQVSEQDYEKFLGNVERYRQHHSKQFGLGESLGAPPATSQPGLGYNPGPRDGATSSPAPSPIQAEVAVRREQQAGDPTSLPRQAVTRKEAQEKLVAYGYRGKIDGIFGPQTMAAWREFEKKSADKEGVVADGKISPQEMEILLAGKALKAQNVTQERKNSPPPEPRAQSLPQKIDKLLRDPVSPSS